MQRLSYLYNLYKRAFGRYTPHIIAIVVLAALSSAAEGIGISAIVPIFSFVGGAAGESNDTITRIFAAVFSILHLPYNFRTLLIFIAALFVIRTALLFSIRYATAQIIFSYERDLRSSLFSKTLFSRWPFLSMQKIGNLEQLLTTNTTNASQFFGNISASVIVITKIAMYAVVAVTVSVWVALLGLVAGIAVFVVLQPLFRRIRVVARDVETTNRGLAHFVGEHVIGMKAVKAMALEKPVIDRGSGFFERMKVLNIRSVLFRGSAEVIVNMGAVVFIGIVFAIMYKSPNFSVAAFAVIVYAVNQIFSQIQAGYGQLHTISTLLPYVAEALSYGERAEDSAEHSGGKGNFSFASELEFNNISFSYPNRGEVLRSATFSIRPGELIGIVGPSGSGKTTVADLLLRLIEPTSGRITVGGNDVREVPVQEWRTHVGYVAQEVVLLNDTIEENIRFYNPRLSQKDIIRAAEQAHIHHFIETLPHGYKTVIGDRGVTLSGGQRQRVALARVLARKPALLILDEATSALDAESEQAIQKAIEDLHGSVTIVVIAHRLSTLATADRFLAVKDGSVSEVEKAEVLGA